MKVSVVTFADLGRKTNLKTIGIAPVIDAFLNQGSLERIVCRMNTGFHFPKTNGVVTTIERYCVKVLELVSFGYISLRRYEEWKLDRMAPKLIGNPDIVLFHPEYFFATAIKRIKKKNPKIISVAIATMAHLETNARIEREEFEQLHIANHKKYGLYQQLLDNNSALNDFDYIIALSDFVKQSYIDAGFPAEKIFVAHTDINLKSFETSVEKTDLVFRAVYVAFTSPLKGLHYLLDAWTAAQLPNSELLIVGDYRHDMPRELRRRYESVITNDHSIRQIPGISHSAIADIYASASVFVFPSLTEGNPRVVMEAMAAGIPVITTTNASSIVVDGQNGFIVPIRDSSAIEEKLHMLQKDQIVCKKMGDNAHQAIISKKPFGDTVLGICRAIHKNVA